MPNHTEPRTAKWESDLIACEWCVTTHTKAGSAAVSRRRGRMAARGYSHVTSQAGVSRSA